MVSMASESIPSSSSSSSSSVQTPPTPANKRKHDLDEDYDLGMSSNPKRHEPISRPITRSRTRSLARNSSVADGIAAVASPEGVDDSGELISVVPALNVAVNNLGPHANKPEPHGQPPVWAEGRGALADSLPYFKAHQGGLHTNDLVPFGMLIDREVGIRDHFGSQIIITSVGGGRVCDPKTGKTIIAGDQGYTGKNCKALHSAFKSRHPFIVIAGAGNRLFPVRPSHYYNVLGYFFITHMWSEEIVGANGKIVNCQKIRMQKVDLSTRSWWAPRNASPHEAGEFVIGKYSCKERRCTACQEKSKEIFTHGWTCLNKDCPEFFQIGSMDRSLLEYNEDFLAERTAFEKEEEFKFPLLPPLPVNEGNALGTEKQFKNGIVCPKCFGCSRRIKWEGWYCENDACDFKHAVPMKEIPLGSIAEETAIVRNRQTLDYTRYGVKAYRQSLGGNELTTWFLPGEGDPNSFIGSVTRIRPSEEARGRMGGLNDLYMKLQNEDIGLKRGGARNTGCRIEELTSHFAANFGAPYKFGVAVKTSSGFKDAPQPVMESVIRITWAGRTAAGITNKLVEDESIPVLEGAIPKDFQPYNEQLILGYFENSKISAHDDGEREVGPNIASLSLGSPAHMRFHPKKKVDTGNPEDRDKRLRQPVLGFVLEHGDMLIMHGSRIQQLYNHAVDPHGKHRFALTCRYIRPETIKDPIQRDLAAVNGEIPEEWASMEYNGQTDRFERRSDVDSTVEIDEGQDNGGQGDQHEFIQDVPGPSIDAGVQDEKGGSYQAPQEEPENNDHAQDMVLELAGLQANLSDDDDVGVEHAAQHSHEERLMSLIRQIEQELKADPGVMGRLLPSQVETTEEFARQLYRMCYIARTR
ncbi:hypothetical protein AAE478_008477 [Parahypoxylon ruwenzoriense]